MANTRSRSSIGGSDAMDRLSEVGEQIGQQASEFGQDAMNAVDSQRERAASGLDTAAEALHDNADRLPGGTRVGRVAHGAANKMSATADYFRTHEVGDMMDDVGSFVKSHPTQSLLGAVALGFFAGWMLRRS